MIAITNSFDKLPEAKLSARGGDITTAMTGNPNFPGPVVQLDAAKTALDEFEAARLAASSGDRYLISVKNKKKTVLIDKLHNLAAYVLLTAKEDVSIVLSAQFNVRKAPQPMPPIEKPENFKVENGINPGELKLSVNTDSSVKIYLFQTTTGPVTPNSQWTDHTTTTSKLTVEGLTTGDLVTSRVVFLGKNQQRVYGDPVTRLVQ
jgi:hypothetical protein